MSPTNHEKGKFLEKLVHDLYTGSGLKAEKNAKLPSTDDRKRPREIDVLLRVSDGLLNDTPILVPIECKNYGKEIGVELIDAFYGKLHDIGVPTNLGIYVSTVRFTSGALGRAERAGIRTLIIEGMNDDRISLKVHEILNSIVFWVARWKQTSVFDIPLPASKNPDWITTKVTSDLPSPQATLDAIWKLWMNGDIPMALGEHTVQCKRDGAGPEISDVTVTAHSYLRSSSRTNVGLRDVQSEEVILSQTKIEAQALPDDLIHLQTHTDPDGFARTQSQAEMTMNIKVPRIIGPSIYWPPSGESLARLKRLREEGGHVSFENVEGLNLLNAWVQS